MSTTGVAQVKEHAERVKPPPDAVGAIRIRQRPWATRRSAHPAPGDESGFDLLDAQSGPVLEEFQDDTIPEPEPLLQASNAERSDVSKGLNPADELTALRPYYERWVEKNGGRTAVGVSGVPQRRFRGVIRFLEAYAAGEDTDYDGRPEDVGAPQFVRYCVDDLKAFYYEARMEQRPGADDAAIHEWYWSETAMSGLILNLVETMGKSDDPAVKAIPYGLAR